MAQLISYVKFWYQGNKIYTRYSSSSRSVIIKLRKYICIYFYYICNIYVYFIILFQVYNAFPGERMVGMYEFMTPSLVLRDTELIEQVLVKDFSTYPDHGPFLMEPKSILFESVFAMSGIRWRAIRYE